MKKAIFYFAPLVVMAFVFVLISPVSAGAVATTASTVVCPAGYVCTPVTPQPVGCPAGYICTPVNNGGGSSGGGSSSGVGGRSTNSCYNFATNLTIGSTGADVVALQTLLIAKGYSIPAISQGYVAKGYFGSATMLALSKYQASVGIAENYFGPLTRASLNSSCTNTSHVINVNSTLSNTSATAVINDNGSQAPTSATITFTFTLTAPRNSDIFLRRVFPGYLTTQVGASASANLSSAVPATLAGDTSDVYIIPANVSRTFTYVGTLDNSKGTTGLVSASVNSIYYGTNASNVTALQITSGLERLKTPSLNLVSNSTTLSVTGNPKITNVAGKAAGNFEIDAGGTVGIMGSYLIGKGGSDVFIGNTVCPITQMSNELIYCTASSNLTIGGTYDLYVKAGSLISNIVQVKVLSKVSTNQPSAQVTINSAYLQNASEDKAGLWTNFGSGVGNGNKNASDWSWNVSMTVPSGVSKYIKRITVKHNTGGEVWSTGYSRYLGDGTDLYGREEHPYPLVVMHLGVQMNKSYDQSLNEKPFLPGTYELKLYGQPESTTFTGGKLIVEFTDGTSVNTTIQASSIRQVQQNTITTQVVNSVVDSGLTVLTPMNPKNNTDIFYVGENLPITWSSKYSGVNRIYLLSESGAQVATILATNDNGVFPYTGSTYSWKIPDNIPTGTYKVRVVMGINIQTTDSGTFKIRNTASMIEAQPTITVVSPKNEQYQVGGILPIKWTSPNLSTSKVNIELWSLGSSVITATIATNVDNTGSYNWSIPNSVKTYSGYVIVVRAVDSNLGSTREVSGRSSGMFTITISTPTPTPTLTSSPTSVVNQSSLNASIWDAINEYYKSNR